MIKLKDLLEISQEHLEWFSTDEYKKWRSDWLSRYNAKLDNKGRVEAYHGTTAQKAKSIKLNGFNERSYFSLNPEYSKLYGKTILKVYLPLDAIDITGPDIYAIRKIQWNEVI